MSLLLNALKKAEEGEQPAGENSQAAAAAEQGARVDASAAQQSESQPVDFDAIVDEDKKSVAADSEDISADKKRKVDAARVFGASGGGADAGGGSGWFKKLLFTLFGGGILAGGGYFVLASGLIPGFDLQFIKDQFAAEEQQVVEQTADVGAQLEITDDIVLLPIPAVDVQSEVDFAALRLPENSKEAVGEDEYVQQIAFLTGFDIRRERTRIIEEQRELLLDLEIENELNADSASENAAGQELEVSEEQEAEIVIQTAEISRNVKLALDSATPSDKELNIVISGSAAEKIAAVEQPEVAPDAAAPDDAVAEENAAVVEQPKKVAQVGIQPSREGKERQDMINKARAFYNNGSYTEAETVYRSVLLKSPANRDALRGLAQIAVITGRYQSAVALYLDLLNYFPNDPVAIAELTNLRGSDGNFYEIEKALKNALGTAPGADGRLYFSLGNLYAQNGDLVKSQKAYFEAFSRETNNPDYAYNLAVVLDYLNKPQLAVRYYQEALHLAKDSLVGFNRSEVESRIKDLN